MSRTVTLAGLVAMNFSCFNVVVVVDVVVVVVVVVVVK
jgi:hypothetical protein